MTAEEFKEKFIVKYKMDTKAVLTYISKLEKMIIRLKGTLDGI